MRRGAAKIWGVVRVCGGVGGVLLQGAIIAVFEHGNLTGGNSEKRSRAGRENGEEEFLRPLLPLPARERFSELSPVRNDWPRITRFFRKLHQKSRNAEDAITPVAKDPDRHAQFLE